VKKPFWYLCFSESDLIWGKIVQEITTKTLDEKNLRITSETRPSNPVVHYSFDGKH